MEDGQCVKVAWVLVTDVHFRQRSTLFQPGAINELIIGVVWVPDVDHPCPGYPKNSERRWHLPGIVRQLFWHYGWSWCTGYLWSRTRQTAGNCFKSNDELASNNAFLGYKETLEQITIPFSYKFEGYKVYQLSNPSVTAQELDDVSKARIVLQTDLKNGVSEIFNWKSNSQP